MNVYIFIVKLDGRFDTYWRFVESRFVLCCDGWVVGFFAWLLCNLEIMNRINSCVSSGFDSFFSFDFLSLSLFGYKQLVQLHSNLDENNLN